MSNINLLNEVDKQLRELLLKAVADTGCIINGIEVQWTAERHGIGSRVSYSVVNIDYKLTPLQIK